MHCLTCRHPLSNDDQRCSYCGARVNPRPWRRVVRIGVLAGLAVVLVVGAGNLFAAARDHGDAVAAHRSEQRATVGTTTTAGQATVRTIVEVATTVPTPAPIVPTLVQASAQAPSGRDACGQAISYDAAFTVDTNAATAWRTKGDGSGQRLDFTLPAASRVLQVGLIPGYAKVDACNGADRFLQYRRILSVRWTFDGQNPVDQDLSEKPQMQMKGVDVTATHVSLEILRVTGGPQLDWTAISDVTIAGVPP
ncbi:MAG: hypothetical protein QOD72_945 [Acidimicrobiaceae bacterium]|nr:hypothetical protein [Acidimicrobiaceae bacterium]